MAIRLLHSQSLESFHMANQYSYFDKQHKWIANKIVESDVLVQAICVSQRSIFYCTDAGIYKKDQTRSECLFTCYKEIRGIIKLGESLYFTDMNNSQLLEYSLKTKKYSVVISGSRWNDGSSIRSPWGVASDSEDTIYITDDHSIRTIDESRQYYVQIAGSSYPGNENGTCQQWKSHFNGPTGIVVDANGSIYVCDCLNHCIRKIKHNKVSTIAGSSKGFQDGPISQAKFANPRGIALDNDGNVLVVDDNGLRILEVKKKQVTTRAGNFRCIATDGSGNIYLGTPNGIITLDVHWMTERLLWIAHFKEDPLYCGLASLPKDLIREIIVMIKKKKVKKRMPLKQPLNETENNAESDDNDFGLGIFD